MDARCWPWTSRLHGDKEAAGGTAKRKPKRCCIHGLLKRNEAKRMVPARWRRFGRIGGLKVLVVLAALWNNCRAANAQMGMLVPLEDAVVSGDVAGEEEEEEDNWEDGTSRDLAIATKLLGRWTADSFVLEQTEPRVGETDVRSSIASLSFVFRNISLEKTKVRQEWVNPPFLKECLSFVVARGEKQKGTQLVESKMWLELFVVNRETRKKSSLSRFLVGQTEITLDIEGDVLQVKLSIPKGIELRYESSFAVKLSSKTRFGLQSVANIDRWTFSTERKPNNIGASTDIGVNVVRVYGVGIFIVDIGDVDMRRGTFSADLQIFLLKYYRGFEDRETAIAEAMHENRTCKDLSHGEKFQFIKKLSPSELQYKLNFINAVVKPTPEVHFAEHDDTLFDHYRVRTTWRFSPQTEHYPFQSQELPIVIEMAGQSVTLDPTALLCTLETFSGFAHSLSSLNVRSALAAGDGPSYTARFTVKEEPHWPPMEGSFLPPYQFPHSSHISRQPSRKSSRLEWVVVLHRPQMIGFLEMAPALFVATSAIITYVLPPVEFRAKITTCTTSMLAAVVQHSSIRNRIPERAVVTIADLLMLVVYLLILFASFSAVFLASVAQHRSFGIYSHRLNNVIRSFGLLSPTLFTVFAFGSPHAFGSWVFTVLMLLLATAVVDSLTANTRRTELGNLFFPWQRNQREARYMTIGSAVDGDSHGITSWSAAEVADWVEKLGLPGTTALEMKQYGNIFFKERIDGQSFGNLKVEMYKNFGIPLGHCIKIQRSIAELIEAEKAEKEAEKAEQDAEKERTNNNSQDKEKESLDDDESKKLDGTAKHENGSEAEEELLWLERRNSFTELATPKEVELTLRKG